MVRANPRMSIWLAIKKKQVDKENNSISWSALPGRTVDKLGSSSRNHYEQWNK